MTAHGIVEAFNDQARRTPDRLALTITRHGDATGVETATFGDLRDRAERYAAGLRDADFREGHRILLAADLSVDFYALAMAIVGSRMTVVFIDGSMERRRLLGALRSAGARGVVGGADSLRRWWRVPPLFRMRRYTPDAAPRGVRALARLVGPAGQATLVPSPPDTPAFVSFTSGSTGRAKGAVRTHGVLLGQHRALARHLPAADGDVDMPCFPAMVLHNLCLGVPTVLPPIDLRRPDRIDPAAVVDTARRTGVTTLSGAPAYIELVVEHLHATGEGLSRVRRVMVGGAPVPRALCVRVMEAFPGADTRVLYGSTEAEPIAHVTMAEVVAANGDGLLVGAPVPEVDLVIADLPDSIDGERDRAHLMAANTRVGEIVVRGAGVSRTYVGDPIAEAAYKVREPGGAVWHRTGDIARLDSQGRLWLMGRRNDAVRRSGRTIHPLPLEVAVGELPGVRRAALVAHAGAPDGELVVIPRGVGTLARVVACLEDHGLEGLPVRVVKDIPMDRRHASKIDRSELASRLATTAASLRLLGS
jgi:olefin beta-lactone synthetase